MRFLVLCFFLGAVVLGFGQQVDYFTAFNDACSSGNIEAQDSILGEWEQNGPVTPEYYTSQFNYYFLISRQETVLFENQPTDENSLQLTDSLGQTSYINGGTIYLQERVDSALHWINAGLEKYPSRLDMWFGKIHFLGLMEDWTLFDQTIASVIKQSELLHNEWTWTHDELVEYPEPFFLNAMHDYMLMVYDTGNDDLLPYMVNIAENVLEVYPGHVVSMSDLGIAQMLLGHPKQALEPLLNAEELAPEDDIVLSNIARVYVLLEDKENAILYYEKAKKYGDEYMVGYCDEQLKVLREK